MKSDNDPLALALYFLIFLYELLICYILLHTINDVKEHVSIQVHCIYYIELSMSNKGEDSSHDECIPIAFHSILLS